MARWAMRRGGARGRLAAVALVAALGLAGCGKQGPPPDPAAPKDTSAAVTPAGPPAAPTGAVAGEDGPLPPPPNDWQHVPFAKATRTGNDPPEGAETPPDQTATGKSTYKVYSEVVRLWDTIRFVSPAGKRINYSATIETDLGNVDVALRPDLAPSHVRSFVALARAGYYDGLCFERVRHEESEDQPGRILDLVEAGCPLGTGERGRGSIGYWLLPEFPRPDSQVTHEEGTLGACHDTEADTAACRFYVTLGPAPFLDGHFTIFGKVSHGLDVVRKIFMQPVIEEDDDAGSHRPEKPVAIRKVTIHAQQTEAQP